MDKYEKARKLFENEEVALVSKKGGMRYKPTRFDRAGDRVFFFVGAEIFFISIGELVNEYQLFSIVEINL